jgi:hypothetical protein
MKINWFVAACLLVLSGLLAGSLSAQSLDFGPWGSNTHPFQPDPRRPRGVYAVVNIEMEVAQEQTATPPLTSPAQLNAYFDNLYQQMLADPAISGIALQVHWDTLNPNPPETPNPYDWTYVDLAFYRAFVWDIQHPGATPKTIQLIVQPGFQSPAWLLSELPSCDPLFSGGTPPSDCGKVTFKNYLEATDSNQLPLPWNPIYKSAWRNFLMVLADRYEWNPALVAISVDGPSAASAEIILPSDSTASSQTFGGQSFTPNQMWNLLFSFQSPALPQNSDEVFVDEWKDAIDMYALIFRGLTLTIATGNGFPNFTPGVTNYPIPSLFVDDCPQPDMTCWSESLVLSHFVDPTVGGSNAKATQTSGMEASRANPTQPPHNFGVASVRDLSQATAHFQSPAAQILGGAQFNTSFSNAPNDEGCLTVCSGKISPEQAEYNVLYVYFYGTPVATFFGGVPGAAPLNYLQIYSDDILYAEANSKSPVDIVQIDGAPLVISAQDLMSLASQKLFEIAEPPAGR